MLVLRSEHKEHLAFLVSFPPEVIESFCKMAADTLVTGSSPKAYQNAAQKLCCEPEQVSRGVEGLSHLLTLGCKDNASELDMDATLLALGFAQQGQRDAICKHYSHYKTEIRRAMQHPAIPDVPHYADLNWRTEVQVAARSARNQMEPVVTLRLGLETKLGGRDNVTLQVDPCNLQHLTQELDKAVMEARGQYARRVQRNIK